MRGVMKQEFKQLRFWQLLSVAGFFINALSLIFMVQSPGQLGPDVLTVVSGIMFWAGLLLGIAGQVVLLRKTKGLPGKAHVGLIRLFTNRYGFIADVTLGVSLIGVFITLFAGNGMGKQKRTGAVQNQLRSFSCVKCLRGPSILREGVEPGPL